MKPPALRKRLPAQRTEHGGRACWGVHGLPGLLLHYYHPPAGDQHGRGWRFSLAAEQNALLRQAVQRSDQAKAEAIRTGAKLDRELHGQVYRTRRDAVEALGVALALIDQPPSAR